MPAERKKTKSVKVKKTILKVTIGRKETYVRAKELQYFTHEYAPLADSVTYHAHTTFGILEGSVMLSDLAPMYVPILDKPLERVLETLRTVVMDAWVEIAEEVVINLMQTSEADKIVPIEVKETIVYDITGEYTGAVDKYIRASVKR